VALTGRWFEARVYPTPDGMSVYAHDISARKRAEEEMSRRAEPRSGSSRSGRSSVAGSLATSTTRRCRGRPGAAGALDEMAHLDEVVDAVRRLQAGTILPPEDGLELGALRYGAIELR
jgi:hypothetical protein